LSRRSSIVNRSRGGNASQSSWNELLPEKEGFLESLELLGLTGPRVGVSTACSGADVESRGGVSLGSGVKTVSLSVEAASDGIWARSWASGSAMLSVFEERYYG